MAGYGRGFVEAIVGEPFEDWLTRIAPKSDNDLQFAVQDVYTELLARIERSQSWSIPNRPRVTAVCESHVKEIDHFFRSVVPKARGSYGQVEVMPDKFVTELGPGMDFS